VTPRRGAAGDCDLIIVSAADDGYFALLQDAVSSVRALSRDVAIGVLDLGLAGDQLSWLAERGVCSVAPGWDVDFPGQARTPNTLKAQIARPFLPRHFPGYATYLWLDADAWVQDWRAVELYCAAAAAGRLAIAIEIDRAYKRHYKRPKLFGTTLAWKNYREAFGWRVADRLGRNPMVNCGVFALRGDAPHWAAWQRIIARVLRRTRFFYVEQIALNYAVFAERLPVNLLPAYCNWLPGDAAPAFDAGRGVFVEPFAPHEAIGVMHLAGPEQKTQIFRLDRVIDGRLTGDCVETSLRYGPARALSEAATASI
jgi:hypothetical protein